MLFLDVLVGSHAPSDAVEANFFAVFLDIAAELVGIEFILKTLVRSNPKVTRHAR